MKLWGTRWTAQHGRSVRRSRRLAAIAARQGRRRFPIVRPAQPSLPCVGAQSKRPTACGVRRLAPIRRLVREAMDKAGGQHLNLSADVVPQLREVVEDLLVAVFQDMQRAAAHRGVVTVNKADLVLVLKARRQERLRPAWRQEQEKG